MRIFTKPFPETWLYVVEKPFSTENLGFLPGEPVGLTRYGNTSFFRIFKTGPYYYRYNNYMEVELMPNLRKLTEDEIASLVEEGFQVEFSELRSLGYLVTVCSKIVRTMSAVPAQ